MTTTPHLRTVEGLHKAGVAEQVIYTVQQQGSAAGRECRVILQGLTTGTYYCAEEECTYTSEKWASVFAHRSKHAKANISDSVRGGVFTKAMHRQLTNTLAENSELRAELSAERARRMAAEKQLGRAKRALG